MNKNTLALVVGISLGLIGSLVMLGFAVFRWNADSFRYNFESSPQVSSTYRSNPFFLQVELADGDQERQKGLMFRQELCDSCAMLFVFPEVRNLSFYMKNTYISLDIIFVSESGNVINVAKNTTPLQVSPTYNSAGPAKYVIEVNSGFAERNSIGGGYNFDIERLISSSIEYDNSFTLQSLDQL